MARRNDHRSIKRQAAALGLDDASQKRIVNLTRQYVFEKINYDSANFVSLTDQDILSFAKAFITNHGSWLQQNRQRWRTVDCTRVSDDQEEDLNIINRMMQLQSRRQKQRLTETKNTSFNPTFGASAARQSRNRPKRRRRRSSTSDHTSIFSPLSSEDESTRIPTGWTEDWNGAGRKGRRLYQESGVADDEFNVMFEKDDNADLAASQHSVADDTIDFSLRSGLTIEVDTRDPMKDLCKPPSSTATANPQNAAPQNAADRSPYQQADFSAQTDSVYRSVSTQNDAPSMPERSTQTTLDTLKYSRIQTLADYTSPSNTLTYSSIQTLADYTPPSNNLTYSSIQTLAEYTPPSSPKNTAEGDKELMVVETEYYQALVYLSLWQEQAGALARRRSETIDRSKIMQLKKIIESVDYIVGIMSHLAQGGDVQLHLREDRDSTGQSS